MQDLIGRTLGHYRIVEKIGAGGMGEVFRAHDERLDRDVAIKVLPEEVAQDADRLARFEREAKAVAKLAHPNILEIWDFGSEDGIAYAVMELLEGESLRGLISKSGLTTGKAVEYARAMADGLAAAHDKGIIHRDIKPENVFLTRDSRIKILDFGLAKENLPEGGLSTGTPTETMDTAPGGLIGTVPYMAPEQVQGQPADHRSDIFALGIVLYELLSGRRPFTGSTSVETAAAILRDDPKPISSVVLGISPPLATVVNKCLEKRPEDRFSSAHDLSLTLGAIDSAAPAPPIRRQSFIARGWPHILAVAAVIALLVILRPAALIDRLTGSAEPPAIRSIAVLPFDNLSADGEQEYLADGMTEALIANLAKIGALKVISRTSVMRYKGTITPLPEIAAELGVDAVVEGSVLRSGDRVRITAQLIHGPTDHHLWADSFDRELTDVLALHAEIAHTIAALVEAEVTPADEERFSRERSVNPAVVDAVLRAQHDLEMTTPEATIQAIRRLQDALELDEDYSPAWSTLARAYFLRAVWNRGGVPPREVVPSAEEAARRALELDGRNAGAWMVLAGIEGFYHWDWARAEDHFRRALNLDRSNLSSRTLVTNFLTWMGKFEEAESLARETLEIAPLLPFPHNELANVLWVAGRRDEALESLRRSLEIAPDLGFSRILVTNQLSDMSLCEDAGAVLPPELGVQGAIKEADRLISEVCRGYPYCLSLAAMAFSKCGLRDRAVELRDQVELRALDERVPPVVRARLHLAAGDPDRAMDMFELGFEERDFMMVMINRLSMYDEVRDNPRFQKILHLMDFPEN